MDIKMESLTIEQTLRQKLHRVRQKQKRLDLVSGILIWIDCVFLTALLLLVLEAIFWFPTSIRTGLIFLFTLLTSCLFLVFIGFRIWKFSRKHIPSDDVLALKTGSHFPKIKDRLADALQVFRNTEKSDSQISRVMAKEALKKVTEEIRDLSLNDAVSRRPLKRKFIRTGQVFLLFFLLIVVFRSPLQQSATRLRFHMQTFNRPRPFELVVHTETGTTRHLYGEDLSLEVQVDGEHDPPESIELALTPEGGEKKQVIRLRSPFQHTISKLKRDLTLVARSGSVRSGKVNISVYQLPEVRTLKLQIKHPAYTGLDSQVLDPNMGTVSALRGSRIDVEIKASKDLSSASLNFDSGSLNNMKVTGNMASASFVVRDNDTYFFEITDTSGYQNKNPITYTVTALDDSPPVARILSPAEDTDVEKGMQLDLVFLGDDDYGLTRSSFVYWIHENYGDPDSVLIPIKLDSSQIRRSVMDWTWDLGQIGLYPEDKASYFYEVWDNDAVNGPKPGRSRVYTVRFPSVMEIYEQVENQQEDQLETLEDLLGQSLEMQEKLSRLSDELKTGKEAGWETRKNLEAQAEQLEQMEKTVEQLQQDLENIIEQLEKHDLAGEAVLEKYQELQKLYQEITTPEFKEAMSEFQEMMQNIPQETLMQEADKLNLTQDSFMKSIERTLNLLKRLRVEQKMDELVHRMEDMKTRQESLNEQMNQKASDDNSDLSESQQQLQEDMKDFESELDSLSQKMEKLSNMPTETMRELMEKMQEMNLSGQMGDMTAQIKSGKQEMAGKQGEKSLQDMDNVAQMLQAMQQQLMSGQKAKVMAELQRASQELLNLSMKQEVLMQPQSGGSGGNKEMEKQANLQRGLGQITQSLFDLSQETFAVTPEMGRALGEAAQNMQQALTGMQQAGRPGVKGGQQGAMGALNQAVMSIQQSMDNMSGSQSGLGAESFMQGLEQLGLRQMALNQKLMDMLNQGQLTLEQQAELSRMAAEQRAIQEQLGEMLRRAGQQSNIPGRLSQLAQEMETVIQELQKRQPGRQTIQRQQRILSRLLEAQNSLQKQDLSRKRQAKTGKDFLRAGPEDLILQKNALQDRIRRELLHLGREGYTKDYEVLIRKYLDAVSGRAEQSQ